MERSASLLSVSRLHLRLASIGPRSARIYGRGLRANDGSSIVDFGPGCTSSADHRRGHRGRLRTDYRDRSRALGALAQKGKVKTCALA